jgi:exonuclease SbcD
MDAGGRVRYSGSPLPLSLAEEGYQHQVLEVCFEGATLESVEPLLIPREVDMLRLPAGSLEEVLERLCALPALVEGTPRWKRPFLEVTVRLQGPEPLLRPQIEAALDDRAPRLVRLNVVHAGDGDPLAERHVAHLADLTPEQVFRRRWKRDHDGEPPDGLLAAYHELVQAAEEAS